VTSEKGCEEGHRTDDDGDVVLDVSGLSFVSEVTKWLS
jgi:hypothetical protein